MVKKIGLQAFIWAVLLSVIPSFAQESVAERVWTRVDAASRRHIWVVHAEEHVWVAEALLVEPGKLQDLQWRREFTNESEAVQAVKTDAARVPDLRVMTMAEWGAPLARTEVPGKVLWKVTQSWNADWEKRYAEWIVANFDEDFFVRNNIATDCADVAYGIRWIFARIHGLPAANYLSGSKVLFSQDSMRSEWMNQPTADDWRRDKRFLTALAYLFNHTYTHTLLRDSYPVKIQPDTLIAGVHLLQLHGQSGHTQLLQKIDPKASIILNFLSSTEPSKVRKLMARDLWLSAQMKPEQGGLLKIRWPIRSGNQWVLTSAASHPAFSKEQYDPAFVPKDSTIDEAILARISPDLDFRARLKGGLETLVNMLTARVKVVEEGYAFCSQNNCAEGSKNYDDWSTPSRDRQIREQMDLLKDLLVRIRVKPQYKGIVQWWIDEQKASFATPIQGDNYTLGAVMATFRRRTDGSDPRLPVENRWGLKGIPAAAGLRNWLVTQLGSRDQSVSQSKSTWALDSQLNAVVREAHSYCAWATPAECEAFRRVNAQKMITVSGRSLSVEHWMQRMPFLISDETRAGQDRWGDDSGNRMARYFEDFTTLAISKIGLALEYGYSGARFTDLTTGQNYSAPDKIPGVSAFDSPMDLMSGWVIIPESNTAGEVHTLRVKDTKSGKEFLQNFSARVIYSHWLAERLLWVGGKVSEDKFVWWLWDLRTDTPDLRGEFPWRRGETVFAKTSDTSALLKEGTAWKLIDFSGEGPLKSTPVSGLEEGVEIQNTLPGESSAWYWLRGMQCPQPGRGNCKEMPVAVNKTTGEARALPLPEEFFTRATYTYLWHYSPQASRVLVRRWESSDDGRGALNNWVFELDTQDPKILKYTNIGRGLPDWDESCKTERYFSINRKDQSPLLYQLTDAGAVAQSILQDEKSVKSICGKRAVFITQSGPERIREIGQNKILKEGYELKLTPEWVLVRHRENGEETSLFALERLEKPALTLLWDTKSAERPRWEMGVTSVPLIGWGELFSAGVDRHLWISPASVSNSFSMAR